MLSDPNRRLVLRCGLAGAFMFTTACGGGKSETSVATDSAPLAGVSPTDEVSMVQMPSEQAFRVPTPAEPMLPESAVAEALPPGPAVEEQASPSGAGVAAWRPNLPVLLANSGASFDLKTTLPAGAPGGGIFGIDPGGAALPAGMSLSRAGILTVGTAAVASVTGTIFTYETA